MTKDWRNPPTTDAGIWEWILGSERPRDVAASFRHMGIMTAPEAARELLDEAGWTPLFEIVFDNGMTVRDLRESLARTLQRDGGMQDALDGRALALVRHLQNLTPPRSLASLPLCEQALDAASDGDLDRVLEVPPFHDATTATAAEVLESFELAGWRERPVDP
jgi:hypothetical protein